MGRLQLTTYKQCDFLVLFLLFGLVCTLPTMAYLAIKSLVLNKTVTQLVTGTILELSLLDHLTF